MSSSSKRVNPSRRAKDDANRSIRAYYNLTTRPRPNPLLGECVVIQTCDDPQWDEWVHTLPINASLAVKLRRREYKVMSRKFRTNSFMIWDSHGAEANIRVFENDDWMQQLAEFAVDGHTDRQLRVEAR